jgi:hypothetical protein
MAHTFKYQITGSSKLPRPFIPLTLWYNDTAVKIKALVDSGADFCMFDGDLSQVLNVDLSSLQQIKLSGINGSAVGYVAHLEIGVNNHFIPAPVVFSFDFSPVGFVGIIGQVGFFDVYKVQFDRAGRELDLI